MGGAALASVILAAHQVRTYFVLPQAQELAVMRRQLAVGKLPQVRGIYVVGSRWQDTLAPLTRYDEFGIPSSSAAWGPKPIVSLLLREMAPEQIHLPVAVVSADDPIEPPSDTLVVDMRGLSLPEQGDRVEYAAATLFEYSSRFSRPEKPLLQEALSLREESLPAAKIVSFHIAPVSACSFGFTPVFTVPAEQVFILTDLSNFNRGARMRLLAAGTVRLETRTNSSFIAGVPFEPGEIVQACVAEETDITFMGKLVDTSNTSSVQK